MTVFHIFAQLPVDGATWERYLVFFFFPEFQFPHLLGRDNDTPLSPTSAHIRSLRALLALTSAARLQNPTSGISVFLWL